MGMVTRELVNMPLAFLDTSFVYYYDMGCAVGIGMIVILLRED